MTTDTRDPRLDPQPGDTLVKVSKADLNTRRQRTVVWREDNNLRYLDHLGKERTCWLDSWLQWAQGTEQPSQERSPAMAAKDAFLAALAEVPAEVFAKLDKKTPGLRDALRMGVIDAADAQAAFRHGFRALVTDLEEAQRIMKLTPEAARN